jgi:integrase
MEIESSPLEEYSAWLRKFGRSESTAEQYVVNVRRAYAAGGPFARLTDGDLSPKYLQLIKASLKTWAQFLGDEELLADIRKVRLPPAIRREEGVPLTVKEWKSLRSEIDSADYLKEPVRAELGMLVCRGFRVGDVLRIKRKEVTDALRKGVIDYEGKGRKRLLFTVAPSWRGYLEILASFKDWERVEDLICPKSKPGKVRRASSAKVITRALNKCAAIVGLDPDDVHPHLLRHTYATLFYEKCKDPVQLQHHMQWASISVAMAYVGRSSREQLDVIADSLFK